MSLRWISRRKGTRKRNHGHKDMWVRGVSPNPCYRGIDRIRTSLPTLISTEFPSRRSHPTLRGQLCRERIATIKRRTSRDDHPRCITKRTKSMSLYPTLTPPGLNRHNNSRPPSRPDHHRSFNRVTPLPSLSGSSSSPPSGAFSTLSAYPSSSPSPSPSSPLSNRSSS